MNSVREEHNWFDADCYVLSERRTSSFINSFLERFLPKREERKDKYPIPKFLSNSNIFCETFDDLLSYLENNPHVIYLLSLNNEEKSNIHQAICSFTSDGHVILGISCAS